MHLYLTLVKNTSGIAHVSPLKNWSFNIATDFFPFTK